MINEVDIHQSGLIHGEQIFEYERPLIVGEALTCFSEIENYYERDGSMGSMGFLTIKSSGIDEEVKRFLIQKS